MKHLGAQAARVANGPGRRTGQLPDLATADLELAEALP